MGRDITKKILENKKINIFAFKTLSKLDYYLGKTHLHIRMNLENDIEAAYQSSMLYEKEKNKIEMKIKEPSMYIGKKRGRPAKCARAKSLPRNSLIERIIQIDKNKKLKLDEIMNKGKPN